MQNDMYRFKFLGEGTDFFILILKNAILSMLTLGIYYPWARADVFKFIYRNIELDKHRFHFHGTGKEMFMGFLKVIAFFIVFYSVLFLVVMPLRYERELQILVIVLMNFLIYYLVGYAFYSSKKYRFSRTSYREIRFRLTGKSSDFAKGFFVNLIITVFSLGFLNGFLYHYIYKSMLNNLSYGTAKFSYNGSRNELMKLCAKGLFFTIITFGIYSFWFQINLYNYMIRTCGIDGAKFHTKTKGVDFFVLNITNALLIIFTFGIGFAWAQMRLIRFFFNKLSLSKDIDLDKISSSGFSDQDAAGDAMSDAMDIDLGIGL